MFVESRQGETKDGRQTLSPKQAGRIDYRLVAEQMIVVYADAKSQR